MQKPGTTYPTMCIIVFDIHHATDNLRFGANSFGVGILIEPVFDGFLVTRYDELHGVPKSGQLGSCHVKFTYTVLPLIEFLCRV